MFYELEYDDDYPRLWTDDSVQQTRTIICPRYPGHQRGQRVARELSLVQKSKRIPDFANTYFSDWILKDHVAAALRSSGFTGFELRRVNLKNNSTGAPLWELYVTGKGGEAHPSSGIIKIRECPYCGSTQYRGFTNGTGIIVDERQWDGSDFFTITAYPKFVLVTERVKEFIVNHRWTGLSFVLSTDLRNPDWMGDEVSPF